MRSPADSVVSFSGGVVDREVLSINHGGGYVSSFEPVASALEVGDTVTEGDIIATLSTYDAGGEIEWCNRSLLAVHQEETARLRGSLTVNMVFPGRLEMSTWP
ncbi:M23 family metallopeptidase [Nesterenkonia salmonea]|uniref:M23 family metallopeptidase n=1 Tax=Nesterenkonia salmonea TaxID=1804987 RepID=UPI001FB76422